MNFTEHAGKLLLREAGLPAPDGRLCASAEEAATAAAELGGPVMVKAQVPAGRRGKAGGVRPADDPVAAREAARAILGTAIGGHAVEAVLVEPKAAIAREFYAAVVTDAATRGPLVLFSTEGGMDIEEVAAARPDSLRRIPVDILDGFDAAAAGTLIDGAELGEAAPALAWFLAELYALWRRTDAELIELNPLAILDDGSLMALDCKLTVDDAGLHRQARARGLGSPERLTDLERRAREIELKYVELDGDVAVLANGAGLTMTTMDVVAHQGGRPANFMEIGGDAYTKAKPALEVVLAKPGLRSLVVNFCGAFARTDVMAAGVVEAWEALRPDIPVFFSVHGTGEDEAVALVRGRLGIEPFERMEDAVRAAVEAAPR